MAFFILGSTCNQRSPLVFSHLTGEILSDPAHEAFWLWPGTYYLVVDGLHMPYTGDHYRLDVSCRPPERVFLPVVLRKY